jgi:hypothetical protein
MRRHLVFPIALTCAMPALAESGQGSEGPWWVGHLITALAAILGAMMIVWQIGRQRRNEIEAQRENYKIELRLHVYQEFSTKLLRTSDLLGSAGMYAFCIPQHMSLAAHGEVNGQPQPVSDRAKQLLDLDSKAQAELAETVLLLEKYLIIHPDLDIFRMALSSAAHDLRAMFPPLFEFMLNHFPMDGVDETGPRTLNVRRFSPDDCKHVERMAMAYFDVASDAQSFLTDIQTELQLLFLGPLFPNRPPRRVPADPTKRVLSLDPSAVRSLRQHFLKNTSWGRSVVSTSMEVHQKFHGRI